MRRQAIRWLRRQWHRPGKHRGDPPPPVRPVPRHAAFGDSAEVPQVQRVVIAPKPPPYPAWKDATRLDGAPLTGEQPGAEDQPGGLLRPYVKDKDSTEGECSAAVRAVRRAYAAAEAAFALTLAPGWRCA